MIKALQRELVRQLQEMLQFKANLFFANLSILLMVSSYLTYFQTSQEPFVLFCLLLTWYFTSHSITHPTFFIEDDLYDRTLVTIIQSSRSVLHVLIFKILVQLLVDLVKAIPIFLLLALVNKVDFPENPATLALILLATFLVIIGLYGLGFALSSLCFLFTRTASITSLIAYFMLYFTGILAPLEGRLALLGKVFPYYTLRQVILVPSWAGFLQLVAYGFIYWTMGLVLFAISLKHAKKRGTLFHV